MIIVGVICIILANVTCVFQTIATPDFSYRRNGYCCSKVSCYGGYYALLSFFNFFYNDNEGCYFCDTSLYAGKVATGIGSAITAVGVILIIIAIILKSRQSRQPITQYPQSYPPTSYEKSETNQQYYLR